VCVSVCVECVSLIAANGQQRHLAADKTVNVNVNVTVTNSATRRTASVCPLAETGMGWIGRGLWVLCRKGRLHLVQLNFIAALNDTPSV